MMIENEIKIRIEDMGIAEKINVLNESHLHIGHQNAGKGHFCIEIINMDKNICNRVKLHKLIYAKLSDLMELKIHALRIKIKGEI